MVCGVACDALERDCSLGYKLCFHFNVNKREATPMVWTVCTADGYVHDQLLFNVHHCSISITVQYLLMLMSDL